MYGVNYAWVGGLTTAFKTLEVGFMWICIQCEWICIWFCSIFEFVFDVSDFVFDESDFVFDVSDFVFDESTLSSASLSLLLLIALAPNIAHAWTFIKKIKQSGGAKSKYTYLLVTDSDRIYRESAKFDLHCNISKGLKGIFKQRKLCVWWILLNGELKRKQSWRQKTFSEARRSLKISGIWQLPRIKWKLDFV